MRKLLLKSVLVIVILSLSFIQAKSQQNKLDGKGIIEGTISDLDNQPLEYANIQLINLPDSIVVTGVITDNKGYYKLEKISLGKFVVKAQFMGFNKFISNEITVSDRALKIRMEPIRMMQTSNQLKEVEINGFVSKVNNHMDKRVVSVSKDLDASTGNAIEVLAKVPSVNVDADKNISIRGRSDITVLIDGKPSTLKGSDALSSISASTIDKIEIITNPSAKYEAQGIAGIINIITKKGKTDGMEGLVNLTAGIDDKYRAETNLFYSKGFFNVNGQLKYSDYTYLAQSTRNRILYGTIDSLYQDHFNRLEKNTDNAIKLGVGVKFPKVTAGIDAKMGQFNIGKRKTGYQTTWTEPATTNDYTLTDFNSSIDWKYVDITGNLNFIFGKSGQRLENLLFYTSGNVSNNYEANGWEANVSLEPANVSSKMSSGQNGHQQQYRLKTDYALPVDKNTLFEAGFQIDLNKEDEQYHSQQFDTSLNRWLNIDGSGNTMNSWNNIYASYLNIRGKWEKLEYQAGMRAEYTDRDIETTLKMANNVLRKLDIFPSVSLGYSIDEKTRLTAAFSRRVHRPEPWILVPFAQLNDNYIRTIGNPALQPELNNNFELGIEHSWNNMNASLTGFCRIIEQGIWQVFLHQIGDNFMYTDINLDKQIMSGAEFHLNPRIGKSIDINLNVSAFSQKNKWSHQRFGNKHEQREQAK